MTLLGISPVGYNELITRPMMKKITSIALVCALFWTAPGMGAFQAAAAVGIAPVNVSVPVGGASVGAAGAGVSSGGGGAMTGLKAVPSMSIQGLVSPIVSPSAGFSGSPSLELPGSAIVQVSPAEAVGARASLIAPGGGAAGSLSITPSASLRRPIEESLGVPLPDSGSNAGVRSSKIRSSGNIIRQSAPQWLNIRFGELREAFRVRGSESPDKSGGLEWGRISGAKISPSGSKPVRIMSSPLAPGSLKPAGYEKAPTPLEMRSGRTSADLSVHVFPRSTFAHAAGEDGGLFKPEDFGRQIVEVSVERVRDVSGGVSRRTPGKSAWFGLGKVAMMLIASLVVAQVGVEALGAAMPSLIQKTFGDFTAVAQLAIVASFFSIGGRQLAPLVVNKFGLRNSYIGANVVKVLSMSLMAGLLATGHMTLPIMTIIYALNGILTGISMTALESIPPAIVGRDAAKLEKFWTWEQTILELAAIATPILTGTIVASFGFLPALVSFPLAMAASLGIVFFTLRIPKNLERFRNVENAQASDSGRGFFKRLVFGAKLVWKDKALRYSFLAYTAFVLINPLLYNMLGPAFGLRLMPSPELAASVQGWMTGLYSMGGLFGGLIMMLEQWRSKKAIALKRAEYESEHGTVSDEIWAEVIGPWQRDRLRKSMLRWLLLGTVGLAMLVPMAFPLPTLGQAVVLPAFLSWASGLTVQAGALILFGIAQVISVLKLRSFFQSRVPLLDENGKEANLMPDAMGFFGSASLLVSTLGLLGLKALFQNVAGFAPFMYLAWGLIPLAALYLFLRWRLSRSSAS